MVVISVVLMRSCWLSIARKAVFRGYSGRNPGEGRWQRFSGLTKITVVLAALLC